MKSDSREGRRVKSEERREKREEFHQPSYLSHQPSFEMDLGYRLPPSHLGSARASTALTLGSASVLDSGGGNCSDCNSALRAIVKMIKC